MSELEPNWPNCKEVQCAQAHELADQILLCLEEECPKNIYIVGKMIRIMDAIKRIKNGPIDGRITTEQFVKYWDGLDFHQHCLISAQSLLKAASLVKHGQ